MNDGFDRRTLLAASGALVVGFTWPSGAEAQPTKPRNGRKTQPVELNGFVRIDPDGVVTLLVPESEMGQGILTAIPMILAEELEVDFSTIRAEHAPADAKRYGRQVTGGSSSIKDGFANLRKAGAAARMMLVAAAAEAWKVPAYECRAKLGVVTHEAAKKRATYGELAMAAGKLAPPADPPLKAKTAFEVIGKPKKRIEARAKVTGKAVFGIDVKLPNMLVARVVRAPMFGGKVKSFDGAAAKKVPGVRAVLQIPSGVAVLGDHFWAAKTGSEALTIEWEEGDAAKLSDASIFSKMRDAAGKGVDARKEGDARAILSGAAAGKKLEAVYTVPYLAHATMEPLNCTADVRGNRCEIWAPTQAPGPSLSAAAKLLGIPEANVSVHTTFLGGGFGRKSQTDFIVEAVQLSKAAKKPVQVIWTREDDMRGGMYRPAAYNQMAGALDAQGWPAAWVHHIASPAILEAFGPLKDGIDRTSVEGASNLPYSFAHQLVTYAKVDHPISIWFWRSVGSSINAYVTECFFDELCALGGKDPLEARRRLLDKKPRHKRVLELAADKAGWGKPVAAGRALGLAVHESFGSIVAQVAEVSLGEGGIPRVHRVVCAVDCGEVVNPATVVAQMESSIVYGLSAALYGAIHVEGGRPREGNFDQYRVLRLEHMPAIETLVVPSGDPFGGIGEPATPPIAPAVANAVLVLTKKPVRRLPFAVG